MIPENVLVDMGAHCQFSRGETWVAKMIYLESDINHIYPIPPLEQDMTQGQFLSGF